DPYRLAARGGRRRDRRPDRSRRRDLLQGARQAARQPHLARGARLPPRFGHHALARPARGAPARRALRAGRGMTGSLVLAAVVAVASVLLVAVPFLREPVPHEDRLREPRAAGKRALALAEERDRALAALKELEFDHRTGKLSDEDYRAQVGPLRRRAAEALRALDGKRTEKEPAGAAR